MRNDLRDATIVEVKSRVLAACIQQASLPDGLSLDVLINETLYLERKRLDTHRGTPGWEDDASFWRGVKGRLGRAGDGEQRALLGEIIGRYVREVAGNFSPGVYRASTSVLPKALPVLLNAMSPQKLLGSRALPSMEDTVRLGGRVDALRQCHERGTVILAPTHVSNLDSPLVGYALWAAGLPPFTYGAGLNLFSNPVLSFFMRNLGAYRVDRLKTAPLYKDVLKEYATVSVEFGQDNLFFPGGTRARSGKIETRLKLGLLSSGLRAYVNNLQQGRAKPRIYIVPCTINYQLVLEASTLIADHLKSVGQSRYIITDDESSRPRQVLHFMRELVNLDARIQINFSDPLDPFGNRIDEDGESVGPRGRRVDIARYVAGPDGAPVHLPQRDRVYTAQAGDAIRDAFRRDTVLMSTNVVAFALFQHLRATNRGVDLYRLLRTAGDGTGVEFGLLTDRIRAVRDAARALSDQGRVRLDEAVSGRDPSRILADALRRFGSYHGTPAIVRRGDRLFAEDMNLLLYYQNRLEGYGLEGAARGDA